MSCEWAVVLEGREIECMRTGPHTLHRYRSPSGEVREFTIEQPEFPPAPESPVDTPEG